MKSRQLSIGAKLWLAVAVILIALIAGMTITNMRSNAILDRSQVALGEQSNRIVLSTRWVGLIQGNTARDLGGIISTDPGVVDYFKPHQTAGIANVSEVQKKLVEQAKTPEEKAILERIAEVRKTVLASRLKALELKGAGDAAGAVQEVKTVFQPAVEKYIASLQEFADLQVRIFANLQADFERDRDANTLIGRAIAAVILLFMVVGAVFVIRQIRQPLKDAIGVAERIAQGDLTGQIPHHGSDEFAALMRALLHMQQQLQHLVADVRRGTDSITVASQEIATGNQDLSHRTEQTAGSLQETASSLEHLTTTVRHSTDAAQQANELAATAAQVAQRGGEVVGQVVSTMEDINASSQKINDIIGVIDGIAFQTNILALNAAVEAARAGEQGRGFAVVASEVRSLAGRSADAAKEIKALISASVEKVEGGSRLVSDAGTTMQEIVSSVQRVSSIIGEISAASNAQSNELGQVNSAVMHLDQMTQQNAALVEQSAAAASSMKDQAHRLAQVVATFKLDTVPRLQ